MPSSPKMMQSAAELIGSVRHTPMTAETITPIKIGWHCVPQLMNSPRAVIIFEIGGPTRRPTAAPGRMLNTGTSRMSSFVFPAIRRPHSIAAMTATNAPSGSPGPASVTTPGSHAVPARSFEANAPIMPTAAHDSVTSGDSFNLYATPTPMPAPVNALHSPAIMESQCPTLSGRSEPIVSRIVPTISVANSPSAMPARPSMKMRFRIETILPRRGFSSLISITNPLFCGVFRKLEPF